MALTDLPNEVLGKVMGFLSFEDLFRLERVNKRFRDVGLNIAWPKIDTIDHESIVKFTDYPLIQTHDIYKNKRKRHPLTDKSVELILSRTKNLQHLDLSFYHDKITSQVCFELYKTPQLVTLNLSKVDLRNDCLKIISLSCQKLEKIYLQESLDENCETGLKFIFIRCENLNTLDIAYNCDLLGESFAYIPTQLKYLNLFDCENLTHAAMNILADRVKNNLETLLMNLFTATSDVNIWIQKLTKLRFFEFHCNGGHLPPLDLSTLKELVMLRLAGSDLVTNETLESLKHCPKLKGLDLTFYNGEFEGNSLTVLKECKALKFCELGGWENLDNYIVDFVETLKIEYLSINVCHDFSQDVLKVLITECDSLIVLETFKTSLHHVEILNEEYIRFFSSILSPEKNPKRSNQLKLVIQSINKKFSSCNWCEVISSEDYISFPSSTYQFIGKAIEQNLSSL